MYPALRRWRQGNYRLKASLGYTERTYLKAKEQRNRKSSKYLLFVLVVRLLFQKRSAYVLDEDMPPRKSEKDLRMQALGFPPCPDALGHTPLVQSPSTVIHVPKPDFCFRGKNGMRAGFAGKRDVILCTVGFPAAVSWSVRDSAPGELNRA